MGHRVSVNIACYNHEDYIGAAIDSVLNQTFQDFELVICNNGSTDNSLNIIESYKDDRIKIESVFPNKQSTWAGNNCVERGDGEYVALLCSDDVWEKDKLQKQVEYLDNHPECAAVFTRCQPIDKYGKFINNENNGYNKHFNLLKNMSSGKWLRSIWDTADHSFCCSSACIRRCCLEEAGSFDIRAKQIQDMILWAAILSKHEVHIIDEKLTQMRYFSDGSNLSVRNVKNDFTVINESYMLYQQFLKIKDLNKFLDFMPEVKTRFNKIDKKYIPFYISILTLENNTKLHFKKSALLKLYDLMGDAEYRTSLEKDLGFTHMDLYEIAEMFHYNFVFKTLFNHVGAVVCFFTEKFYKKM